jgi:hypothetical protein
MPGYGKQRCTVVQKWSEPERNDDSNQGRDDTTNADGTVRDPSDRTGGNTADGTRDRDQGFGWFKITSGARYIDDTKVPEKKNKDFENISWDSEYRKPEKAPEKKVQIEGEQKTDTTVTFTNSTGDTVDATLAQKVYVAYEIVEDIEKPNLMGMMFYLDVPAELAKDGAVIV